MSDLPKSHREIELKFEINHDQEEALNLYLGKPDNHINGSDAFWDLKYPSTVAFLRFRQSDLDNTWEVKVEDKGTPRDRVEVALPSLMGVMSEPDFYLTKVCDIWKQMGAIICIYYVIELDQTYLEIEAQSMKECLNVLSLLNIGAKADIKNPLDDSLFTIGKAFNAVVKEKEKA